jgi:hypothetical protein
LEGLLAIATCRSGALPSDNGVSEEQSMNIGLWVMQVVLALVFFAHGWLFLSPPPEIAEQMNAFLPRWFQLFLGVAEVMAAVGITVPGLTGVRPRLVVWAAAGIVIVMVSATLLHVDRGEMASAAITLVLLTMAGFVAYMRHRVAPIPARRAGRAALREPVAE